MEKLQKIEQVLFKMRILKTSEQRFVLENKMLCDVIGDRHWKRSYSKYGNVVSHWKDLKTE